MSGSLQETTLLDFEKTTSSWIPYETTPTFDQPLDSSCTMRIATWNVWEDDRHIELRHPVILNTLFAAQPSYNIILLQEVIPELFHLMLKHPLAREHWLITDLNEQLELCPNPYSTVILISKTLASGFAVSSAFMEYENTRMERSLNIVEFSSGGRPQIRFATSHFESHPEDIRKRAQQFRTAAHISTSKGLMLDEAFDIDPDLPVTPDSHNVPAIIGGDCNLRAYEELSVITSPPYLFVDALLHAQPCDGEPLHAHPTFGMTLTHKNGFYKPKAPRRLDYILTRGSNLLIRSGEGMAGTFGQSQISKPNLLVEQDDDDDDDQGSEVWLSDHLGVWVTLGFTPR